MSSELINEKNFKLWPRLGMRAAFGLIALELSKNDDNMIIVTGDVSTSAGLDRFRKQNPNKYLDVGIAEQNLLGIAAGLSSEGFNVITTTFAPFQTMRCCEQIKVNLGYMNQKVCMIGLASGLVLGTLGFTHCCIEDIGVLRSIPNLNIISPADTGELAKAVIASVRSKNSTYIRLTGGSNCTQIYEKDYDFNIGKSITLRKGKDLVLFATGTMVANALKSAEILESQNISCEVVNFHTIKPIDIDKIRECSKRFRMIATIEEHNIIGGLGSAVSECLSTLINSPMQIFFGINDKYSNGGEYAFLLKKFNLNSEYISKKIIEKFQKVKKNV